ncbi:MAG TPA: HAMP domain-containing protein, partial [Desulfuromonadaceae bacterium]
MYTFRNVSIQRKLTLIVMLPSTVALLLACLAFFVYDAVQLRRAMVQEVTMLSQVIGADNTAALVFDDPKSVTDNLALLSANSHVAASCIFTPKGTLFGSYIRSDLRERLTLPPPQADGYAFGAEYLTMFRRIEFNNKTVGTSYVQYDLAALRSRMHDYLGMAVIVLLTSSCVILVLSSWLTRTISEPVLSLAKIAKDISQEKNYSVRAEEHGHDEIGVLINGFNEMLEQIQERDLKLARHSEELEKQVAARTAELEVSNANLRTQMMENEKIQEELFKTRQLESLGILAGGIAHDFNNLLTAILGNVSLAKRRISRGDEISGNLAGIETAGIRANDLTRQLLTFSKGGAPIKELASIEDVIGDSAQSFSG